MNVTLEQKISNLEYALSTGAIVPVLGIIPAAMKVILGAIQAVCGLLVAVFTLPFAYCNSSAKELGLRGLSHFVNGIANIISGCLEGIPFVGSMIVAARWARTEGPQKIGLQGKLDAQRHMILIGYEKMYDSEEVTAPFLSV